MFHAGSRCLIIKCVSFPAFDIFSAQGNRSSFSSKDILLLGRYVLLNTFYCLFFTITFFGFSVMEAMVDKRNFIMWHC